ncbi:hypothetical protein [Kitasatospora griseola]|uniref:hypothetical protein n=1 Tax=Kitasatospora griseola TaxID=2064 RepID=UPI00380643AC
MTHLAGASAKDFRHGHCFFCPEDGLRQCRPVDIQVNEEAPTRQLACSFHYARLLALASGLLTAA